MVSSDMRGSPSSLHEDVVEKYPSFDALRDSTAIESTNSLDLNKVLNTRTNERGHGGGEKKRGEKKQSILEECAEVVLNEGGDERGRTGPTKIASMVVVATKKFLNNKSCTS